MVRLILSNLPRHEKYLSPTDSPLDQWGFSFELFAGGHRFRQPAYLYIVQ